MADDFDNMDKEGQSSPQGETQLVPHNSDGTVDQGNIASYRDELVNKYHQGSQSLIERLQQSGNEDGNALLMTLIDEVIKETDNLLGNHLVATENGDLRDASVISYKRAEVLEKAIKAVQSKQQIDQESGIDVDSPSMMIVFRYFMRKAKEVFSKIDMPDEQVNLFFQTFSNEMTDWKRELREELESVKDN